MQREYVLKALNRSLGSKLQLSVQLSDTIATVLRAPQTTLTWLVEDQNSRWWMLCSDLDFTSCLPIQDSFHVGSYQHGRVITNDIIIPNGKNTSIQSPVTYWYEWILTAVLCVQCQQLREFTDAFPFEQWARTIMFVRWSETRDSFKRIAQWPTNQSNTCAYVEHVEIVKAVPCRWCDYKLMLATITPSLIFRFPWIASVIFSWNHWTWKSETSKLADKRHCRWPNLHCDLLK